MKKTTETIYVAKDGTKFLSEKECEKHESRIENTRFFAVLHNRDLTETGLFSSETKLAVLAERHQREIAIQYVLNELAGGKAIHEDVMGFGYTSAFEIIPISRPDFANEKTDSFLGRKRKSTRVFITEGPAELKGVSECCDKIYFFRKEWKLDK